MASPEGGGVVASFTSQAIGGVEDLRQKVHGADVSVTQLTADPCRGSLFHTVFDDMAITRGHFTGDLRIRGVMAHDAVTLGLILEQTQGLSEWGHETRAGDLLVFPPGNEQEARYKGSTRYAALKIPMDLLLRRAEAYGRLGEEALWRSGMRLSPPGSAMLRRDVAGCLSVLAKLGPELSARAVLAARDDLVERCLSAAASSFDLDQGPQPWINSARILRQVEDYLDGQRNRQVNVLDICEALALSRRTLHRAFHDVLDMGPKTYLRLRSLSAARKALTDGRRLGASVTQVALDHGFWELGRFSVTYRQMFGESPSQTLRGHRLTEARSFAAE
ncbi:MAG: helix-turn-helix domain-containing protein [Caulobacter sp.]|nr:helix-turn-helix domain-containing protein [Caulobacter sp.]